MPLSSTMMNGKRGIVFGVANDHSIAWGIARTLAAHGAQIAFTYQGDLLKRRVLPLAKSIGSQMCYPCDVEDVASVDALFRSIADEWGKIDFLVHAVAYSDKNELRGRFVDITRENFLRTMLISCFSFTEIARSASALMPDGGSLVTLSYEGANRVMPNYHAMGMAKAALESSVRYLASDLGRSAIRVNAISPGPMRTLAGAGIADARYMFSYQKEHSPLAKAASLDDVGGAALYLLSDLSLSTTGTVLLVDGGYHSVSMPRIDDLKALYPTPPSAI